MHRQFIMSHNLGTDIKNVLTHSKMDTRITFHRDILSIISNGARRVQMADKPLLHVHLNLIPV